MKTTKWLVLGLACALALAAEGPRGTVPRAAADKYAAHAEQKGVAVGASLLTAKEAGKAFATEVDRCCMVVEVALYPPKDGLTEVSLDDFSLRIVGQDIANKPSSAELVAGKLHRKAEPEPSHGKDVTISPTVGIGYETGGVDPVTGQRRPGGVVTSTGVGVGIGGGGGRPPRPGASEADRRTMELELREKGLPEGAASAPVAGYLYFSQLRQKKAKYQLEYTVNGERVVLPL